MARTRDIMLATLFLGVVLIAVVFVVVSTINKKNTSSFGIIDTVPIETAMVVTALSEKNTVDVIDGWRKRLKDFKIPSPAVVDTHIETNTDTRDLLQSEIKKCTNYALYTKNVPQLNSYIAEGARVYTSIMETGVGYEEQVFLVIPVRDWFIKGSNCLQSDVVGIATNGLLIKNNQINTYNIFGSETLIGYALDGYPIYGLANNDGIDECGGKQVGEGYHYYLTSDRQTVLQCFRAQPAKLP
jgi:hypothetical protein